MTLWSNGLFKDIWCYFDFLLIAPGFPHSESHSAFPVLELCRACPPCPNWHTPSTVQCTPDTVSLDLHPIQRGRNKRDYHPHPRVRRGNWPEELSDLPATVYQLLSGGVRTHTWVKKHQPVEPETSISLGTCVYVCGASPIPLTVLTRKGDPGGRSNWALPPHCAALLDVRRSGPARAECGEGLQCQAQVEAPTKAYQRQVSPTGVTDPERKDQQGVGITTCFTKRMATCFSGCKERGAHCDTCFSCENDFKLHQYYQTRVDFKGAHILLTLILTHYINKTSFKIYDIYGL